MARRRASSAIIPEVVREWLSRVVREEALCWPEEFGCHSGVNTAGGTKIPLVSARGAAKPILQGIVSITMFMVRAILR